jgi:Cdc6-like AAA superfamily ATPase
MVPFGKNLKFVGREEELARIEDIVNGPPTKVAIYGLGGVGKTQIALELAYRIREKHSSSVFWVPCTSHEAVDQAFSNIAQILRLHSVSPAEAKGMVKAYLEQDEGTDGCLFSIMLIVWTCGLRVAPPKDPCP